MSKRGAEQIAATHRKVRDVKQIENLADQRQPPAFAEDEYAAQAQVVREQPVAKLKVRWQRDRPNLRSSRPTNAPLRNRLHRKGPGCGVVELESQHPLTCNIPAINLRRLKLPALRGFHGQVGKIPARPGRIEGRTHHVAQPIDVDSHTDPHSASNGVSRALGHLGQDSIEGFTPNNIARRCPRPRLVSKRGRRGSLAMGTLLFIAGSLGGLSRFRGSLTFRATLE